MAMKAKKPNCANFRRCGRQAKSVCSKFCEPCFKLNAAKTGRKSSGNKRAKGITGNAGNSQGNPDNAGNSQAQGKTGNAGNAKRGAVKTRAGKRSGVKRSAKRALVVKKKWLELILARQKTWEIRGSSTSKRGWIHLAQSKAGGQLVGRARLVASFPVSRSVFKKSFNKHRVPSLSEVPYDTPHAWVLEDAEEFDKPFQYEHKQGAVVWVDV